MTGLGLYKGNSKEPPGMLGQSPGPAAPPLRAGHAQAGQGRWAQGLAEHISHLFWLRRWALPRRGLEPLVQRLLASFALTLRAERGLGCHLEVPPGAWVGGFSVTC